MKDRLLADLDSRISRHRAGDSSGVLDDGALAVVAELTATGAVDTEVLHRFAALHLCRYEALPPGQGEQDLQLAQALYAELDGAAEPHANAVRLMLEYERTGRLDHLERAITLFRRELDGDRMDPAICRHSLASALLRRFERFGQAPDLHEAIGLNRAALMAAAPHHPQRPWFLAGLALCLLRRFELTTDMSDVDEAIALGRQVVAATPGDPNHPMDLSNLAMALYRRFELAGQLADLDEAIALGRRATADTGHPNNAMHLSNLCSALMRRFERTGNQGDLDEAIEVGRRAITATPADHPGLASYQAILGRALGTRYERTGQLAELDESVELGRRALAATPADHPIRAARAAVLAEALRLRFERTGQQADLDEAIERSREAVAATPEGDPSAAGFLAIAVAPLVHRFERTGRLADLDEAIAFGRKAIAAVHADHPSAGPLLSSVGAALRFRFEHTGQQADLDEGITLSHAGADAVPDDHIDRGPALSNLARALRVRYQHAERPADLEEAIAIGREALAITPDDHVRRAAILDELGFLLQLRFERTGQRTDLDAAIAAGRAAAGATQAPLPERVGAAARRWGGLAGKYGDHDEALAGITAAVGMLPALAWHGLDRSTREHHLAEWSGLASEAAAFALNAGRPERAVELLEHGRSVLWTSILHTRGDLSRLAEAEPETAARLDGIRALLDGATPTDRMVIAPEHAAGPPDRARLAREWDETVDRVRCLPGFEHFLAPTPFAELGRAADEGPVVIVNVAHARCDALIVRASAGVPRVDVVPLPGLTLASGTDRVNALITSLHHATRPDAGFLDRERARHTVRDILAWLSDTTVGPVIDALGPDTRRMWWCPTGVLTLLPLHAAVPPDVIPSYTTTLTALLAARRRAPSPPGAMLAVGLPDTPGIPQPLPAVPAELQTLRRHMPAGVQQLVGSDATRAAVLSELRDHSWTHWSCHGGQDLADPSSGAVFLWDGPLTVLDLAEQRLDRAELAYLSACQTAVGGVHLTDEAIHLAAAFQLAGYRHVIATLWAIHDDLAPTVADTVYRTLTTGDEPDATRSAEALHAAVAQLRADHPTDPTVWAAYVHHGP